MTRRPIFAASMFALVASVACARRGQQPASLRSISLPDLSRASESVKTQLQDAYASLTRTTQDRAGGSTERSDAYGRMGMLFMAAEFREEAEACFRNSDRIFSEANIDGERARTLREWARYELRAGNREKGEKMWREAREIFARLGADLEVERLAKPPA